MVAVFAAWALACPLFGEKTLFGVSGAGISSLDAGEKILTYDLPALMEITVR